MSRRTLTVLFAALLCLAPLAMAPAVPVAGTTPETSEPGPDRWAPVGEATIYPSVYTISDTGGCTSNFVFEQFRKVRQPDGSTTTKRDVFLGTAAHCVGLGTNTDTNGCTTGSLDLGSDVTVRGAAHPARLAYSSWKTMIDVGQAHDSAACRYNDFALLELDPRDHAKVNPSLPFFGGPTGVGGASQEGDPLYSVGNSSLRLGIRQVGPKFEYSLGMFFSSWQHMVYAVTPGIPGDSGSGHVNDAGEAMGVTSTIYVLPTPGSNGVTDLASALAYLHEHTDLKVQLATGTEPFDPVLP